MQARQDMRQADKAAEEAVAIDAAREPRNASPTKLVSAIPVFCRWRIQIRPQVVIKKRYIPVVFGVSEKLSERDVAGQMRRSDQFQPQKSHVCRIEIDGVDALGLCDQIVHDIAAAGSDGHDSARGLDGQRFQIDDRVLPNLGIDHALESHRKQPLLQSGDRQAPMTVHRMRQ